MNGFEFLENQPQSHPVFGSVVVEYVYHHNELEKVLITHQTKFLLGDLKNGKEKK